jgi:undecaprenyl-diphosphatase
VRSPALTDFFIVMSAWWVKSLVYIAAGLVHDLRDRRPPLTALTIALAFGLSSLCSTALKYAVDRPRPPHPIIDLPSSPSFPSGHATTAFAAAVATAMLIPSLRWPALILAALVSFSRVYLGVHYPIDIIAGAVLGAAVGYAVTSLARRLWLRPRPSARPA